MIKVTVTTIINKGKDNKKKDDDEDAPNDPSKNNDQVDPNAKKKEIWETDEEIPYDNSNEKGDDNYFDKIKDEHANLYLEQQ